jgi:hypothetical protein
MTAHFGDRLVLDPTLPGGAGPIWTARILPAGEAHLESAGPPAEPSKVDL